MSKLTQNWLKRRSIKFTVDSGKISIGNSLDLRGTSITDLGQLTSVGGSLYLEGNITIMGEAVNIKLVDGIPTIIGKSKTVDGVKINKAWYARGFCRNKPVRRKENVCFVASALGHFAHGDSARKAAADLDYKIKANAGKRLAIKSAITAGGYDMPTWRASSGACESGTIAWLRDKGVSPVPDFIPLDKAKVLMSGSSYGREVIAQIELLQAEALVGVSDLEGAA